MPVSILYSHAELSQYTAKLVDKGVLSVTYADNLAQQCRAQSQRSFVDVTLQLFKQDEQYLLAIDLLQHVFRRIKDKLGLSLNVNQLGNYPCAIRAQLLILFQQKAILLQRLGQTQEAGEILDQLLKHGFEDHETLGLLASNLKARAQGKPEPEKQRFYACARTLYLRVYESDKSESWFWHGLNGATLSWLVNDLASCKDLLLALRQDAEKHVDKQEFWYLAALAEIELLAYVIQPSAAQLKTCHRAFQQAINKQEDQSLIRSLHKNARLILSQVRAPACLTNLTALVDDAFVSTEVRISSAKQSLQCTKQVHWVASPASADLEQLKQAQSAGQRIDILVPYPWPLYIKETINNSSELHAWQSWLSDIGEQSGQQCRIWTLANQPLVKGPTLDDYISSSLRGLSTWLQKQYLTEQKGVIRSQKRLTKESQQQICTMVFADFKGYSQLNDSQVCFFFEHVLADIANEINPYQQHLQLRESWGDAFCLVFDDSQQALECSLAIQTLMNDEETQKRWQHGLEMAHVSIRLAVETGPLNWVKDPIENKSVLTGNFMSRTARIEPIVEVNQVYCGLGTMLDVLAHNLTNKYEFHYLGLTPLAKAYGAESLFSVVKQDTK